MIIIFFIQRLYGMKEKKVKFNSYFRLNTEKQGREKPLNYLLSMVYTIKTQEAEKSANNNGITVYSI